MSSYRASALPRSMRQTLFLLITMAVGVAGLIPLTAAPAHAAAIAGLTGEGSSADPLVIDSADDLDAAAKAVNTDFGTYGTLSYRLGADVDYADAIFVGFDRFGGVFDGDGHSVNDLVYSNHENSVGFFRDLDGATVRGLTLTGVSATSASGDGRGALIAGSATNATLVGNTVVDSAIKLGLGGAVNTQAGGLVGYATGATTITDNALWNVTVTGHKYAAGVVAYPRPSVVVARNLLVDVTVISDAGGAGATAGLLISQGGAGVDVTSNVVYGGSASRSGGGTSAAGPAAMTGSGPNLISSATKIKAGSVVGATEPPTVTVATTTPGSEPSVPDLTAQSTYAGLGWDFASGAAAWRWEAEVKHPVPARADLPPLKQAGVPGAGTAGDPYQISSAADLAAMVEVVNTDFARYGSATYQLTSDIDLGGDTFVGLDRFAGVLLGDGHTLSNLVYGPSTTSEDLGLIRSLTGTVRGLHLSGIRVQPMPGTTRVAGLAVSASSEDNPSSISLVEISDALLTAPQADIVAGLVAEATGLVDIHENAISVEATAKELVGGVVGLLSGGASVRDHLVEARLSVTTSGGTSGTDGVAAGLVVGAPSGDDTVVAGNVVTAGSVAYSGLVAGHAGRVIGETSGSGEWKAKDNLANTSIEISGARVAGPGVKAQHGSDTSVAELATKATYSSLRWNFIDTWRWDAAAHAPVIKYVLPDELPNRITATFYGDPRTQRAFTWYQDVVATESGVLLSTDPNFPDGATALLQTTTEASEDGETIYRSIATGLTPGLTYYYRVGEAFAGIWSGTGQFTTADGESDFSFIDIADTQARGGASEAEVSAATMAKALTTVPEAEFLVHNGDVVQNGEDELDWSELFAASQDSLLATTIAPVSGNHDLAPNRFVDHFLLEQPNGQDTTTGAYYSYDYNGAHFVMLNTNDGGASTVGDVDYEPLTDAQLTWMRADIEAARKRGADWIILTTHKGPYTAGSHPTEPDMVSLRQRLVPLIDELDIDLVLQGHDHYWSRTPVLESDPAAEAGAAPVPTDQITEVVGGVHIDYNVDPEGTIYVTPGTAGAKHYAQVTDAKGAFDLEAYLDLFDRLGGGTRWGNSGESFLEVKVAEERLTVNRFEIVKRGKPTFAEGFGIDRQVSPIDDQLAALPVAADIVLADEPVVVDARQAVKTLTKAQRSYLDHLDRLLGAEEALRVLHRTQSIDGSEIAWADSAATTRQSITVRNVQRRDLADVPVRLTITDTPAEDASTLMLTTPRSVPVSFEVESWQAGGTSVVWAKLPELAKTSSQVLWAYFGGAGASDNDSSDVWHEQFELVEHFATDTDTGETLIDSTGSMTATLVGAGLTSAADSASGLPGGKSIRFDRSRLQYGGNLGRFAREFTVSAIYSLTQSDLNAIAGQETSLIAKREPGAEAPTLQLGVIKADGKVKAISPFDGANADFPVDGTPHLVTMTFDGMTYAVFVDGVEASEAMAEFRQFPDQPGVPTTVGDTGLAAADPNTLVSPFHGVVDELWVARTEFIPELEAFRADNYFGDAVVYGPREERADDRLALAIGSPGDGAAVEAGNVEVSGSLTKRSILRASIEGESVFEQQVDAGTFTLPVPVLQAGEDVEVVFSASAVTDPAKLAEPVSLVLDVADTTAPVAPLLAEEHPAGRPLTLTAQPQTDVAEKVEARFFTNSSIALDESNVVVRTGSTTDRVPTALQPSSGQVSPGAMPTTVGDDENPYQIYEIGLTPEQAAQSEWHFSWRGRVGDRTVSAWVWNSVTSAWVLKASTGDENGGQVNLDVRATVAEGAVSSENTMRVLVWRGLTELPWAPDRDYDNTVPSPADYDWSFNHVGDTQLYSEATPWTMTEQFEYIDDHADERKTAMVVQAGDWVNREEYEDEWQWLNAEPSAQILEEAKIPYLISWGNHDYNLGRNGRQMITKYFPMQRFEDSLEGSPWTFGGSNNIDNYFYTGEIDGAKILWLEVGFWSAETDEDPAFDWAQQVIEQHPDHTVILSTHNYLVAAGSGGYSNPRINTLLVDPYPNVRLVLTGHNSGTFVSSRTNSGGTRVYGILTDYQTRAWGGHGFLKNLSVDAENGLIYVNTYSPWLQTTTSDGRWNYPVDGPATPGFHGNNAENYVIELDLGGVQTRRIETDRLTLSAGAPTQLGETLRLTGDQIGSAEFDPALGQTHEWYAVLTDASGNTVTSPTRTVRRVQDYTISYDLGGGRLATGSNPSSYTVDSDPITLVNPTRDGYEFAGWTGTGLARPTIQVSIATGSTGPRAYAATWSKGSYTLSYDLAGGFLASMNPASYAIDSAVITLVNPTRGGHDFVGWVGTGIATPTKSVTIPTGSIGNRAFTAIWATTSPDAVTTTVTIDSDLTGSYGASIPVRVTVTDASGDPVVGEVILSGIGEPIVATLSSGRGEFGVPGTTLPGSYVVGIAFTGTETHLSSSVSGVLTVAKPPRPKVSLRVENKRGGKVIRRPEFVVLGVTGTPGLTAPTGTLRIEVTGRVKKRVKGSVQLKTVTRTRIVEVEGGRFRAQLPARLKVGRWTVSAVYSGSDIYPSSAAKPVRFRVRK